LTFLAVRADIKLISLRNGVRCHPNAALVVPLFTFVASDPVGIGTPFLADITDVLLFELAFEHGLVLNLRILWDLAGLKDGIALFTADCANHRLKRWETLIKACCCTFVSVSSIMK
jgi:hypothetical protein